jgi:hypothetical protein
VVQKKNPTEAGLAPPKLERKLAVPRRENALINSVEMMTEG